MAYGQNMKAPMAGITGLAALKGRQGDNTLVHVNPMELKALDNMAPGGLTRNPYTGLPEAFKLKDLLPTLGAIAGTVFLGPMMGPMLASGLGAAGGTALAGGNKEEILGAGVVSGATAGLMGGASPTAAAEAAGQETLKKGLAAETTGQTATNSLTLAGNASNPVTSFIPEGVTNFASDPLGTTAKLLPDSVNAPFEVTNLSELTTNKALQEKIQAAATQAGKEAFVKKGLAGAAGAAIATPVDMPGESEYKGPTQSAITEMEARPNQAQEVDEFIRKGGPVPQFFDYRLTQPYIAAEGGQLGDAPRGEMFSGMVEGKGDGMSDEVAFDVVGDPEVDTAMLSPDEYVIDAHTVAALGNGSSDAGAARLDEFRKALREKVYGRKEQPNQINPQQELSKLS
jgi:hypothetical protein